MNHEDNSATTVLRQLRCGTSRHVIRSCRANTQSCARSFAEVLAYDQINFNRGVDAFVKGRSATSVYAICPGLEEAAVKPNQGIGITEQLLDARSFFLTPNTTIYALMCVNLKDGPMVVRVPPRALGSGDNADFRWVTDVGLTGPAKGEGGDDLFVHPRLQGSHPRDRLQVSQPRTNRLLVFCRVAVVQNEPADWMDPYTVGLYAAIGIRKWLSFACRLTGKAVRGGQLPVPLGCGAVARRGSDFLLRGRTCKLTLPAPVPAKDFWAFKGSDNLTRSLLPTDQKSAGLDSNLPGLRKNADGGGSRPPQAVMNPGARISGSTILQGGVQISWTAQKLMALYNKKGIFANTQDNLEDLKIALSQRFECVAAKLDRYACLAPAQPGPCSGSSGKSFPSTVQLPEGPAPRA